jgi:hypothetical protein
MLTLVPVISVPVAVAAPFPPVFMQIAVMNPVILARQMAIIIRGHVYYVSGDAMTIDIGPPPVIDAGPVPATAVEPVPPVVVEIKARCIRYHIDVGVIARNNDYVRRFGEYKRCGNADADMYIPGRRNKWNA